MPVPADDAAAGRKLGLRFDRLRPTASQVAGGIQKQGDGVDFCTAEPDTPSTLQTT